MNKLSRDDRIDVIHHLVEGNSIRSTERLMRIHRDTVLRLLARVGMACDEYMDLNVSELAPEHWEIDEIWTYCQKKEKRLTAEEMATGRMGDQYLFLAIGQKTKFIPCYLVGRRNAANALAFMKDLAFRFYVSPYFRHRLSTDGFKPYIEAVEAAFKGSADYGITVKEHTADSVASVRRVIRGYFDADKICTSHVERNNLSIRTFMRRFCRRSLSFSKSLRNLRAAVALHVMYYNYCRVHSSIKMTPAMAARRTRHPWGLRWLLDVVGEFRNDPHWL